VVVANANGNGNGTGVACDAASHASRRKGECEVDYVTFRDEQRRGKNLANFELLLHLASLTHTHTQPLTAGGHSAV
jgi:hypothetical protein